MLFLNCPFCKSPTKYRTTENATFVFNGQPVCSRPLCRERFQTACDEQSMMKCRELGIPWRPELSRPYAGAP